MSHFLRILRAFGSFLWHFYPMQLLLLHLRRSHLILLFWLAFVAMIKGWLLRDYGFQYLFLTPEYLDQVGFTSFFITGIAMGLFIMAFHVASYIFYSYRYPFLATLSRPLYRFSINNSVLPFAFILLYVSEVVDFYEKDELNNLLFHLSGLLLGTISSVSLIFSYFFTTIRQKDLAALRPVYRPLRMILNPDRDVQLADGTNSGVTTYLRNFVTIRVARRTEHYDNSTLLRTLQQHHLNAAIFFATLTFLLLGLSLFSEQRIFMIPAGATLFILLSLYLMIVGAIYYRFKTWTVTGLTAIALVLNYLSGIPQFQTVHHAFGLNYDPNIPPVEYTNESIDASASDSLLTTDKAVMLDVLKRWKAKTGLKKPRLILVNTSGGGQRSSLWTFQVLQELDQHTQGQFFKEAFMITGSSGGMLGAAFYRELILRNTLGDSINPSDPVYLDQLGRDLLNPVAFTLVVNDLFFRLRSFSDGKYSYPVDRGLAFERKLNENTGFLMNRRFGDYTIPELNAQIPMMIFAPTIINDGRRMLMSPHGLSFLTYNTSVTNERLRVYDGVEYLRMFRHHDPLNLRFVTMVRMSASFPYITPLVDMPSQPTMELIDAGVRDNDGFELGLRFLHAFRDWINTNTSGVVIVQIKGDRAEGVKIQDGDRSKLSELIRPLGGVIRSFSNFQIYSKANLVGYVPEWLDVPMDVCRFNLIEEEDKVSLSWHLTQAERQEVMHALDRPDNKEALEMVINN